MINCFVGGGVRRRSAIYRGRGGLLAFGCSLMLAFVVGCGSTVQLGADGQNVLGGLQKNGLGGQGDGPGSQGDGLGAPRPAGSGPGTDVAAGRDGTGAVGPGAGGTGPSAGPGAGGGRGGTGRGVTKDKVYIGMGTAEDAGKWAEAAGLKGLSGGGDYRAFIKEIIKDIDRHGGLESRTIEIVWHDYKTGQLLSDPATANQAACEDWTRDHQVFAVLNFYDPTLASCLQKTNTPLVNAGAWWDLQGVSTYQGTYQRFPNYYLLGGMLGERFDKMTIERMVARNFFQKWDTGAGRPGSEPMQLGILMPDTPNGNTSLNSIVRQLARHGIKPADIIRYSFQDLGVSGQQNAVLKFRSAGITHVFGAGLPFMNAAEKQGYFPRHFIKGAGLYLYEQNAPASQLRGAMSPSLQPAQEVGRDQDPGDPSSATTYCMKFAKAAGFSTSDRIALWAAEATCDQFFFLKDAIDKSGELTSAGLQRGLEALGNRPSALTWKSQLGPGEHASGRSMRDLAYKTDCKCFVYTSTKTYTG